MPRLDADLATVTEEDMQGPTGPLPPGEYAMQVVESDYKPTKAGNGMVLGLTFEAIEPGVHGKVWEYLCLEHPNEETVRIARAKLKRLAIATGHPNPDYLESSEELHHKPVLVKVKVVPARGEYGPRNEVLGYARVNGGGSQSQSPSRQNASHSDDIPF